MPRKKKEPASVAEIEALQRIVNERYGEGAMLRASDSKVLYLRRIPTGIFSIDAAVGGGFPLGRIIRVYGKEHSCKTAIALKFISSVQRYCRFCYKKISKSECELSEDGDHEAFKTFYVDAEHRLDGDWMCRFGINMDLVWLFQPEYAEEAIDVTDYSLRTGDVDLLVIDTLAAFTPKTEVSASSESWQQGLAARLINKMFRKICSAQNVGSLRDIRRPTIIVINQTREKIGILWGEKSTEPGGIGQRYYSAIDLKMSSYIKRVKGKDDEDGDPLYAEVTALVSKNNTAPPMKKAVFKFWFQPDEGRRPTDVNNDERLFAAAKRFGVVEGRTYGKYTARNQAEFIKRLGNDQGLYYKIYKETMKKIRELMTGEKEVNSSTGKKTEHTENGTISRSIRRRKKSSRVGRIKRS